MPKRSLPTTVWTSGPQYFILKPTGIPDGVKYYRCPLVFIDRKEAESTARGRDRIIRGELVLKILPEEQDA